MAAASIWGIVEGVRKGELWGSYARVTKRDSPLAFMGWFAFYVIMLFSVILITIMIALY
jgi:hypothetical protein